MTSHKKDQKINYRDIIRLVLGIVLMCIPLAMMFAVYGSYYNAQMDYLRNEVGMEQPESWFIFSGFLAVLFTVIIMSILYKTGFFRNKESFIEERGKNGD